ncbi:MAG: hypothetical protein JWO06_1125 [Bacteroidota bacterium]|nr:hypothetical protein [Bacteroidota bacterium]
MKFFLFLLLLIESGHAYGQKMSFALPSYPDSSKIEGYSREKVKNKGYYGGFDLGYLFGIWSNGITYQPAEDRLNHFSNNRIKYGEKYNLKLFKLSTSHGYLFNPNFFLGAGGQVDMYRSRDNSFSAYHYGFMIPVFADFRYTAIKNRFSPIVRQQIGYTFYVVPLKEMQYAKAPLGGPLMETSLGARVYISSKASFILMVGYRFQDITQHAITLTYLNPVKYSYPYRGGDVYDTIPPPLHNFLHYITITGGFSF